jgi:precorrin-6Y C5,15-methyltransferase (decarboxylating)
VPEPFGGEPVSVVGVHGGEWFGRDAGEAVRRATVLVGASRHLDALAVDGPVEKVTILGDLARALDVVEARSRRGERVCVLASGDPGFFGVARLLRARLGASAVCVHPAPSAVALAFARAGHSWDDAVVVSAHGRPAVAAVEHVVRHPKVAVLCSPETPPEAIGRALLAAGCGPRQVTVASRLGEPDQEVWSGAVEGLAARRFDPLSVVTFVAPDPALDKTLAWGLPEPLFAHRAGMITKSEVRAVALGKLSIPRAGVMWDVGAGSGSVSAECCALAPGLRVFAVERDTSAGLLANLAGTPVTVVEGSAPACLGALPDPDRVFVGGGGLGVLEAVLGRLRPGGVVVATFASPERASAAARRLGNMVQVCVNRLVPLGDGSRLSAENPVFVCWGPE